MSIRSCIFEVLGKKKLKLRSVLVNPHLNPETYDGILGQGMKANNFTK